MCVDQCARLMRMSVLGSIVVIAVLLLIGNSPHLYSMLQIDDLQIPESGPVFRISASSKGNPILKSTHSVRQFCDKFGRRSNV